MKLTFVEIEMADDSFIKLVIAVIVVCTVVLYRGSSTPKPRTDLSNEWKSPVDSVGKGMINQLLRSLDQRPQHYVERI